MERDIHCIHSIRQPGDHQWGVARLDSTWNVRLKYLFVPEAMRVDPSDSIKSVVSRVGKRGVRWKEVINVGLVVTMLERQNIRLSTD